jgi:16S rRNA (uracil1498-N3)-methyltransferase
LPSGGGPLVFVEDLDHPVLSPEDHHHLARVRRLRDGDPLVAGDGLGRWRPARMAAGRPESVGEAVTVDRPRPAVGVGFALVKGTKPELVVQKLTELGVDRIVPFASARSVVRWDPGKAAAGHQRLERVAREAAMQSRQPWIPTVEPVSDFASLVVQPGVAIAERGGLPPGLHHPMVLVGPEGGWAPEELAADAPRVALATGVLRAETAAITAAVMLVALRAGLVGPLSEGRW